MTMGLGTTSLSTANNNDEKNKCETVQSATPRRSDKTLPTQTTSTDISINTPVAKLEASEPMTPKPRPSTNATPSKVS